MKYYKILLLVVGMLLISANAFCMDLTPEEIPDLITTMGGAAALVIGVSELLIVRLRLSKKLQQQLLSWFVSLAACFGLWYLDIGIMGSFAKWYEVLITGILTGLTANGLFDIGIFQYIVYAFILDKDRKELLDKNT